MSAAALLLALAIGFVAALVHGSVGIGIGLVAGPSLVMIDPAFAPGAILANSAILGFLIFLRERKHVDLSGVRTSALGLIPGIPLGVAALSAFPEQVLTVAIAVGVIGAVGLLASGTRLPETESTRFLGGLFSGMCGAAVALPGPPIALCYANEAGPRVRSTLGAFSAAVSLLSVIGLTLTDKFGTTELALALRILPGVLAGFAASFVGRAWIDTGKGRPAILILSALAGLAALIRAF